MGRPGRRKRPTLHPKLPAAPTRVGMRLGCHGKGKLRGRAALGRTGRRRADRRSPALQLLQPARAGRRVQSRINAAHASRCGQRIICGQSQRDGLVARASVAGDMEAPARGRPGGGGAPSPPQAAPPRPPAAARAFGTRHTLKGRPWLRSIHLRQWKPASGHSCAVGKAATLWRLRDRCGLRAHLPPALSRHRPLHTPVRIGRNLRSNLQ
jgi:hypothetical protein